MTDDITRLLHTAAPTETLDLDLDRARREGRARARRRTTTTAAASAVVLAGAAIVAINWPSATQVTVNPGPGGADVAAERAAAGCVIVPTGDPDTRRHFDLATAPGAEAMYDVPLPSAGDHLANFSGVPDGMSDTPLDVRAVVHNLEHGAIAIWIDPDLVDPEEVADIATWARTRRDQGFIHAAAGAGVIVSPVPNAVSGVAPISLRAWGVAVDCDNWNQIVADDFLASHYGTSGDAPEGFLAPYPTPDPFVQEAPPR